MIDPSISDEEFGRIFMAGASKKTARKRITEAGIPYQVDRGHWLIRLSDAEVWREARMHTPAAPNIKSMLDAIAARTLRDLKTG